MTTYRRCQQRPAVIPASLGRANGVISPTVVVLYAKRRKYGGERSATFAVATHSPGTNSESDTGPIP